MEAAVVFDSLALRDRAAIWHPFTQMQTAPLPIVFQRGEGSRLYTYEGECYIDGISSWWVNLHGHCHPYICASIASQLQQLEHVIFTGFTHLPAILLAEKLLTFFSHEMSKVFYSDNGSTAIEVALKMALQYWDNKETKAKRRKIICFKKSFHGETFGAMSAAGKNAFNRPFWSHLFDVEQIDIPLKGQEERSLLQMKMLLKKGECAAFIFEPLVLGSGGMILYAEEGLQALVRQCQNAGVITIADEVMTGFGRTGPFFAAGFLEKSPDIICLAKGLSGGFLPIAATICNEKIYNGFLSTDFQKALLHGHSYSGNPLACSAALASLELLQTHECQLQRENIAQRHREFCLKWKGHPRLLRCQSLGTILVLEYRSETTSYFDSLGKRLARFFLDRNILLRPLGNVLYVMPPYCITQEELEVIYHHIVYTLENSL